MSIAACIPLRPKYYLLLTNLFSENVELRIKHGVKKTLWALDKSTRNQLNALTGVDALYRMAVSRGWMTMGQHNLMIAFIVSNDEVVSSFPAPP